MNKIRFIPHPSSLLILFLVLILAACGGKMPTPTATSVRPANTAVPVAQATDSPTETAVPNPTATLPPPPTAPPPSTATPIPTPTATATPEPVTLLTLADFGDNRNPLTGELVPDPSVLQRRPIAVKLSNSPPEYTRPQAGLNQADLVFEHVTEGPITRFTAVFYSQTPPDVGPIRSARMIDIEIPAMYDTALVFSGASSGADGVYNRLAASDFRDRLVRDIAGEVGYYRIDNEDIPWEHRLHAIPEELWQRMDDMGINVPPTYSEVMAFSSETPPGGTSGTDAVINYRDWTVVEWQYDAENGRYWRWSDGEPHLDANTSEQVNAANVVIVYAIHQQVVSICESQSGDVCNAHSTEIQIWGQGDAIILRDGQQFPATWKRENRSNILTFYDDAGDPIPLQIGNTWFQLVPYHYSNPVTIE
ncbi:MAG: DUF3048 domain-containing protein [Ardenticatenaceae bacterium]|nr:DUF3048 domain-containing protein [Ardenticatenaceae bacterium]MCB8991485.1 DUF3048 domain-containing protein [Ardenticatenaceae bacterium]MCB9004013.1 DUF3048 domain-containing protein [Ardenticatenaceae bacterium]